MLGLGHPFVCHINEKQTARLRSWFLREFTPVLRRWQDMSETARPFRNPDEAVIWTVWLQGADEMPEDCRMYIDSVRKHNPNRPLEIVDLATVRQYVDIPEFILHRYEAGTVNAALLTDYIKFALLERYGGIWVDATVYQLRLAGEDILEYPMWSVKNLSHSLMMPLSRMEDNGKRTSWLHSRMHCSVKLCLICSKITCGDMKL